MVVKITKKKYTVAVYNHYNDFQKRRRKDDVKIEKSNLSSWSGKIDFWY
jgi:ATP-dependent protease Clp ATPase subunit